MWPDLAHQLEAGGGHFLDGIRRGIVDAVRFNGVKGAVRPDEAGHFHAVEAALGKIAVQEEKG
jgi:hypothetical protein